MSERTTSDSPVNANPVPQQAEQQAAAPPAEQAAPAVQQQAEQAAEQAAQREAEQREQAEQTRQAAIREYRKGERSFAAAMLEAGRLSGQYVAQRLALGDQRAAAVQALEGEMAKYSSSAVDANRLILTYHGYRLLAEETGLTEKPAKNKPAVADAVPYGTYRDCWARLVERTGKGTAQETYVLLPGLEAECKAAFAKAAQDALSTKAVAEMVSALVRDYAARQAAAEKQRAAEAEAKAKAEREAAEKAAAALREAKAAAEKAAAEAKAKQDAATSQAAAQALADLEAKQRAMVEQQAKAEQAERDRAKAEKAAKEQAERDRKAAEKAARKTEQAQKAAAVAPPQQTGQQAPAPEDKRGQAVSGNLLRSAKEGSAKDVGEMAADFLLENEAPDDALESMLTALVKSGDLSAKAKRACEAALLILTRQDKPQSGRGPSPVAAAAALANSNGHVAAPAA